MKLINILLCTAFLLILFSAPSQAIENSNDYSYDLKKVAVMRFENSSKMLSVKKLQERMTRLFYSQGYYTVSPRKVRKAEWSTNCYNSARMGPPQVKQIARELNADLVVGGHIQHYEGKKGFRGANLMAFPVGLGFVLYGKVAMKAVIYDGVTGQKIWENQVIRKKKNFFGGLYQGKGAVLDKAVSTALNRLFSSFFRKDF